MLCRTWRGADRVYSCLFPLSCILLLPVSQSYVQRGKRTTWPEDCLSQPAERYSWMIPSPNVPYGCALSSDTPTCLVCGGQVHVLLALAHDRDADRNFLLPGSIPAH